MNRGFWLLVVLSSLANAEPVIYPTHPGTNLRDHGKPGLGLLIASSSSAESVKRIPTAVYFQMCRNLPCFQG